MTPSERKRQGYVLLTQTREARNRLDRLAALAITAHHWTPADRAEALDIAAWLEAEAGRMATRIMRIDVEPAKPAGGGR